MLKTLKSLIGVSQKPDAPSTEIESALAGARDEMASAMRDRDAAEAAYRAGLVQLDEVALQKLMADKAAAIVRRDRAEALVEVLSGRLVEVQAAEDQAQRQAQYDAAARAQAAAGKVLVSEYPKLARALAGVLRTVAEADLLAQEANERLPAGVERLHRVEDRVRREKDIPARIVSDTREQAWCFASGNRVDPDGYGSLKVSKDGKTAVWQPYGGNFEEKPLTLRTFRRVTTKPEAIGKNIRSLAATLNLPRLLPSHVDFWRYDHADWPAGIIRYLDEAEPKWGKSFGSTVQDDPSPHTQVILLDEPASRAA